MLGLHACELLHALQNSGHSTFISSTGIVKFEGSALDGGHGHFHYQCLGQELTGRVIRLLSKSTSTVTHVCLFCDPDVRRLRDLSTEHSREHQQHLEALRENLGLFEAYS